MIRRLLLVFAQVLALGLGLSGCDLAGEYAGDTCLPACLEGEVCNFGACVPIGSGAAGTVGSTCVAGEECSSGTCFSEGSFVGGYCSDYCGAAILAGLQDCAPGSVCLQVSEAAAICADLCGAGQGDCRTGYLCTDVEGTPVCLPGCKNDGECAGGQRCSLPAGACVDKSIGDGSIGSPCGGDDQCPGGVCLTEADSEGVWKGGYCLRSCDAGRVGSPCVTDVGGDGICVEVPGDEVDPASSYVCFADCASAVDCRADYLCTAQLSGYEGIGYCLPGCTTYGCDAGLTCDSTSGLCLSPSQAEVVVSAQSLGTVSAGATKSTLKSVNFTLPADTISATLVAKPQSTDAMAVLAKFSQPDGKVLLDLFDPLKNDFKVVPLGPGTAAATFPNAPRLSVVPGTYTAVFGAEPAANVDLHLVLKTGPAGMSSGQLPVVVWITKQNRLTAASAPNDPTFQGAMQQFKNILAQAGITVTSVTYRDVPGPIGQAAAVVDDDAELAALFAAADGGDVQGLNFFLIDQFASDGGGYITLGQSGGIPGPPSFVGLPHAGVAVCLAYLDEMPAVFASTLAHEAGHYLGLFHTTEQNGKAHDPLLDTPQCSGNQDTNWDGLVSAEECGNQTGKNLMFWLADETHTKVSTEQGWVLRRNPMVQ